MYTDLPEKETNFEWLQLACQYFQVQLSTKQSHRSLIMHRGSSWILPEPKQSSFCAIGLCQFNAETRNYNNFTSGGW